MADNDNTNEIDLDNQDPDIFGKSDFDDDGTEDVIRRAFDEQMGKLPEEDDGGFDQPFEDIEKDKPDVVGPDEGRDLLDDAEMKRHKGAKPEAKPAEATPKDGEKAEIDKKPEDEPAKAAETEAKPADDDKPAEAIDLTATGVDALLDGVPDDRKAEVSRRLGEADKVLAPFAAYKDQLSHAGKTPIEALNRLLDLNNFAQQKPDEYLLWVAQQSNGEDPGSVLESAAKKLGMKLVKEGADDEMFDDAEKAELKAREAERTRADTMSSIGPDAPGWQVQQQINAFTTATDENGQLKYPRFNELGSTISQIAANHAQTSGQLVTVQDLPRFYAAAEAMANHLNPPTPQPQPAPTAAAPEAAPTVSSAAQATAAVEEQIQKNAAAVTKAQRASKSVDGSGQGASRQPALPADASLEAVIGHFAEG